jgi:hypothetical protein
MRTVLATLALVVVLAAIPAHVGDAVAAPGPAFAGVLLAAPAVEVTQDLPQINVEISDDSGPSLSPTWIAIGVIGLLLVAVLFKMSNRGGK